MEFSGDTGRDDAPKRPQEMDAAAHLIREKGYAPEQLGLGPVVDVGDYSAFGAELGELTEHVEAMGPAEDFELTESVEALELGYTPVHVEGWEPAGPTEMEDGYRPWPRDYFEPLGWNEPVDHLEFPEQMDIADAIEPVVNMEYVGSLEAESHVAPAVTPEEELHIEVGHELEIWPQAKSQSVPVLEPKPVGIDELKPELEIAHEEEPVSGPTPELLLEPRAEAKPSVRSEPTEKKQAMQADAPSTPRVIVWKDFPKPRR